MATGQMSGSGRGGGGSGVATGDFQKGDFVTDGLMRGLILRTATTGNAKRPIQGYMVDLGGGQRGFMAKDQIRLIAR